MLRAFILNNCSACLSTIEMAISRGCIEDRAILPSTEMWRRNAGHVIILLSEAIAHMPYAIPKGAACSIADHSTKGA